jgi:hypothetical protein
VGTDDLPTRAQSGFARDRALEHAHRLESLVVANDFVGQLGDDNRGEWRLEIRIR